MNRSKFTRYCQRKRTAPSVNALFSSSSDEYLENISNPLIPNIITSVPLPVNTTSTIEVNTFNNDYNNFCSRV